MSDEATTRLAAIRQREQAATKGSWYAHGGKFTPFSVSHVAAPITQNAAESIARTNYLHDAEFIAHARTDIPYLLALLADVERRHQEEIQRLVKLVAEPWGLPIPVNAHDREEYGDDFTPTVDVDSSAEEVADALALALSSSPSTADRREP